jgi:KDO2-lipid IV(A) lauroyltransferase
MTFLEFLHFTRHPERVAMAADVHDEEFRDVLATGHSANGAMMVTPHLGNWELLGQVVAAHGVRLCAVAQPIRNSWGARLVDRARRYHGLELIPVEGAARGMLRAARAGKPIGMLMDQNTRLGEGGMFADFFGLPVATTRAPAALARRLELPVVVAACVREEGRLRVRSVRLPRPVSGYSNDSELTQALMAANEELIRAYPEQYAWMYRRWRYMPATAPPEVQARYPFYAKPCPVQEPERRTGSV